MVKGCYKLQVASISNGSFADIRPRQWKTVFEATSETEVLTWIVGNLNRASKKRSFDPESQWIRLVRNGKEIAS